MTMGTNDNPMADVRAFLPWLAEMGADEIILDRPVNRFADELPAVVAKPAIQPDLPAPQQPPASKTVNAGPVDPMTEALALAAGAATIPALAEAWTMFDAHPLKRTATRLCFFGGAADARILVLCDKPRSEEDPMGEVLSARHQALAERMLAAVGLCGILQQNNMEQVALANFVPWRPPGNRAVVDIEAKLSVPFARRLVSLLMPKAILCLGALAGQHLAGGDPAITRARGKWRSLDIDGREFPMMTTFHPETLLKSPQSKRLAWQDLQAFRGRLTGP